MIQVPNGTVTRTQMAEILYSSQRITYLSTQLCFDIFNFWEKKKEIPVEVISIDQIAEKEVVATFSIPTIHTLIE